eukprot:scaffold654_cov207-Ochromonas_danica.AAC.19
MVKIKNSVVDNFNRSFNERKIDYKNSTQDVVDKSLVANLVVSYFKRRKYVLYWNLLGGLEKPFLRKAQHLLNLWREVHGEIYHIGEVL